jgi:hypothetical protein
MVLEEKRFNRRFGILEILKVFQVNVRQVGGRKSLNDDARRQDKKCKVLKMTKMFTIS